MSLIQNAGSPSWVVSLPLNPYSKLMRPYWWIGCLTGLCLVAMVVAAEPSIGSNDGIAFWTGAQLFINGQDPYDPALQLQQQIHVAAGRTEPQRFLSPPWALPLLAALFWGGFGVSRFLLIASHLLIMVVAYVWCRKHFGGLSRASSAVFFLYLPFIASLQYRQLGIILLVGVMLAYDGIRDPHANWGKLTLALHLLFLKPQGIYLFLIFLLISIGLSVNWQAVLKMRLCASPLLFWRLWNGVQHHVWYWHGLSY
jgi:hypothetical protein